MLEFVSETIRGKGYPPTVREVNAHFGFSSPGTARDHLKALERKGCLTRVKGRSRGLELAQGAYPDALEVPLVGAAPAGAPLLAMENVEETLPLPKGLFASGDFALRLRGDSMVEAGIRRHRRRAAAGDGRAGRHRGPDRRGGDGEALLH